VAAYLELTKPKLWWLLTFVALAAMALAAGPTLDLGIMLATVVGGVLAIAASGTFNNVLERDRDRWMARTADRPVVRDRVPPRRAAAFGVALATGSVVVFVVFVNALAAALGLLAILFYAVVYTVVLKPNTDQNTVLGGAAGVFPALIGWAAVENAIGVPALVLGAVIFLWTPAHFYNLALVYREDYARAGFPMLPVVRGAAVTRRHTTLYLGGTMLAAIVLGAVTRLDWLYAGTAVAVGVVFLWAVVRQYAERTDRSASRTFMASNVYLGLLLVAVFVDALTI
jgi:protoheme IX farnesyltransferase